MHEGVFRRRFTDADAATEATDTAANAVAPGVQTVLRPLRDQTVH